MKVKSESEVVSVAFQPKPTVLVSGHNGAQVLDASSQKEFSDRQRDR